MLVQAVCVKARSVYDDKVLVEPESRCMNPYFVDFLAVSGIEALVSIVLQFLRYRIRPLENARLLAAFRRKKYLRLAFFVPPAQHLLAGARSNASRQKRRAENSVHERRLAAGRYADDGDARLNVAYALFKFSQQLHVMREELIEFGRLGD